MAKTDNGLRFRSPLFEFYDLIRCASDDLTEFFQGQEGDVLVLLQRIQRLMVQAVVEKIIL